MSAVTHVPTDIEWLRHAATTYRALAGEMVTDKARAVVSDEAVRFERIAGELEELEALRAQVTT